MADQAVRLEGSAPGDTYLCIDKLVEFARRTGCEAVHPGYGFLSENPVFGERLVEAGLQLIGPPPVVMRAMGDKIEAKARMSAAGVPVVPGWDGDLRGTEEMRRIAGEVGYPLLVKAAAGGGGRGMRRVASEAELDAAIDGARSEAGKAFGDDRVFLERYLPRARHIEFQIFGDRQGNAVHLFERECSVQRRHQKIVEESPSVALGPGLRARMGDAAARAARAIGYENAGTVEFLLDAEGNFYFLEVNARLQVEHPVTEWVTGLDLVHLQLRVATGEPLPFTQDDLTPSGHALECRIYAEDPESGFMPSTGVLQIYREPGGAGVRVDSGVRQGDRVSPFYDAMLAKLVVWAEDRARALDRMDRALSEFVVLGVRTNIPFLRRLLRHPAFVAGDLHTHFLDEHRVDAAPPAAGLEAAAAAGLVLSRRSGSRGGLPAAPLREGPWQRSDGWRLGGISLGTPT
jgi:acetyl/propionyl-CoA carboxylase alpha subunit